MSKRHDEKQISACCQDYQNGKTIREILLRYSISKTTLYRWLQLQKRTNEHGFDRKTISELDKRFTDRQDNINSQYRGDIDKLTSNISKYNTDNINFYLNDTNQEYYFTSIQNLKDVWNNLAVSWKNVKSTLKNTLDNMFKFSF